MHSTIDDGHGPSISFTLRVLVALFVIAAVWACFGEIDIIAEAPGKLLPVSYLKIVQPADAGVVSEILVSEGQPVKEGQVLVRLDPKNSEADGKSLNLELGQVSLALRRIDAELHGAAFSPTAADPAELAQQALEQYKARRLAYSDALAQETSTLSKLQSELKSAASVREKYEKTLPSFRETGAAYSSLAADGLASHIQSVEKDRERVEKEKDYQAQIFNESALQAGVSAQQRKVGQVSSEYLKALQQERAEAVGRQSKLQAEWAKLEHKSGQLELRAPKAGVVKDLAVHNLGAVVSPGTVLVTLVPVSEELQAEVWVKNDDVGFLYPTQPAQVKISAFPFQKFGLVPATVRLVSADAAEAKASDNAGAGAGTNPQGQTAAYRTLVALTAQSLMKDGKEYRLKAGMQVQVEVNLGKRTVLEYLLSPVQKTMREAMRER